jgi:hypothetical protein
MVALVQHAGKVTDDGLILRDLPAWKRAVARQKGHDVVLTIRRVGAERPTQDQYGYYYSTILPLLAEEWGWSDPAELHYRLKEKHIPRALWVKRRIGGVETLEPPSMADLTVEQTAAYMQAVIDHATEEGIRIPPPRGKVA